MGTWYNCWVTIKEIGLKKTEECYIVTKLTTLHTKKVMYIMQKNKVRKTRRLHTMIKEINIDARFIYKQGFSL